MPLPGPIGPLTTENVARFYPADPELDKWSICDTAAIDKWYRRILPHEESTTPPPTEQDDSHWLSSDGPVEAPIWPACMQSRPNSPGDRRRRRQQGPPLLNSRQRRTHRRDDTSEHSIETAYPLSEAARKQEEKEHEEEKLNRWVSRFQKRSKRMVEPAFVGRPITGRQAQGFGWLPPKTPQQTEGDESVKATSHLAPASTPTSAAGPTTASPLPQALPLPRRIPLEGWGDAFDEKLKQVEIGWTTADAEPWTSKRAHIDLEGWGDEVKPAAVPEPRKRLRSMDGWGDAKPTIEKPVEVETGWEVKTQGARWTEGWGQPSSSVNNAQTIAPPPNEVSVTSQRPNDWTAVTAPSSLNPRVEVNTAMGEVETGWESKEEAPAVDAWTSVARGDEGPMDTETGWEMPPKPTPSDDWTVRAMQSMPVEKRDVQNGSRTAPSTHPRQLPPSPFPNTRPDPAQTKYDDPTDRIRSERAGGPVAREPLKRWFATDRGHFNYPEYAGRTLPRLSPAPMPELQPGEIGYYQGPYERSFPKRSIQPAPTHPSTSSAPCLDQEGARQLRSQVTDRQDPRHPLYEMSWQPTGPLPRTLFQERQHTGALRQAGYSPRDIHEHNQWTRSTGGCGRHAGPLSTDNLPAAFPLAPPSSSTASDPSFHYPAPSLPRSPPPRSSPPCAFPPPPPSSALPQTAHQLAAPTTAVLPLTPPHSAYGERAHEPRNGDRGTMRGWPPGGHRNNRPRPQLRGGRLLGQAVKGITPTPSVRSVGTQTDVSKDKTTQTEAWADIL